MHRTNTKANISVGGSRLSGRHLAERKDGGKLLQGADWVIGESTSRLEALLPVTNISEDAIDNIATKVDLLQYCHANDIKVRAQPSDALIFLSLTLI